MKKIAVSELNALFAAVSESEMLYIPADDKGGQGKFTPWQDGLTLSARGNTARSAKDLFFPQTEHLVNFRTEGKTIEIQENREEIAPFAVFGVRACDCRSFDILDKVFLSEPVDTFYAARREKGTVITLACSRPAETCF